MVAAGDADHSRSAKLLEDAERHHQSELLPAIAKLERQ
jgi:hypothetical protein